MSAAEHYAEAERLLRSVADQVSANVEHMTGERKADVLAAAQVHATLAATGDPCPHGVFGLCVYCLRDALVGAS